MGLGESFKDNSLQLDLPQQGKHAVEHSPLSSGLQNTLAPLGGDSVALGVDFFISFQSNVRPALHQGNLTAEHPAKALFQLFQSAVYHGAGKIRGNGNPLPCLVGKKRIGQPAVCVSHFLHPFNK